MADKLQAGESMRRLQQEETAINSYLKKREIEDMQEEERRKKRLRERENEMKRMLDLQMRERED
eukprot:CAMPEP_0202957848 /NCGR_PEP_ID=MMETSP1396-20130829/2236_1 /ASSEMBLY_ACC=CAM_ASM_000872 /TAXON_ID= /ORGANISM="Pseudokeronopsis sp., Strain Brazil" /LENGTH=63 /DNA_ID=CAMNT_0049675567 /DNA_START=189 /DNA_END=380 /DNA_ORIENTATION=-